MKNIQTILLIVLAFAVTVLYFLHFSGKKSSGVTTNTSSATGISGELKLAYVNSDSLALYYKYFDELKEELLDKRNSAEKQLGEKKRKFQEDVLNFQKQAEANMLSNNQLRDGQERLSNNQNELYALEQNLTAGLMAAEQTMNDSLTFRIKDFIERYNKDKGYHIILGMSDNAGILYADKALDVTSEVLEGLNKEYTAERKEN